MAGQRDGGRRADAVANRAVLLDAATRVLLRDGPGAPMKAIADEAGVGVGTLYRNFAGRDDLWAAVVHRSYELVAAVAATAAADTGEPVDALLRYLTRVISERHRLALPMHGSPAPTRADTRELAAEISRSLDALLRRGVAAGVIRPDAVATDVILAAVMLIELPLKGPPGQLSAQRMARIVADGFRRQPASFALAEGLSRPELDQALTQIAVARPLPPDY
jgi:AcrR family transcriptional regulator